MESYRPNVRIIFNTEEIVTLSRVLLDPSEQRLVTISDSFTLSLSLFLSLSFSLPGQKWVIISYCLTCQQSCRAHPEQLDPLLSHECHAKAVVDPTLVSSPSCSSRQGADESSTFHYLVEIACMSPEEGFEERKCWVVVSTVGDVHPANKPNQPTGPRDLDAPDGDVADHSLLVVGVQGGDKLSAQPKPGVFGPLDIGADHIRATEVLQGFLVMGTHHPLQHACVV